MHHRRLTLLAVAAVAALGISCDDTKYEKYVATLDGSQENPPVATGAAGNAVLLVSQDGSRVDITVTLTSPLTDGLRFSHIHKNVRGQNGSVIHNLWLPTTDASIPFDVDHPLGKTLTFTAENLADLRAGSYYVNVHSNRYGSGEIRGQLERVQ